MLCTSLLGALVLVLGAPTAHAAVGIDDAAVTETDEQAAATFTVTRRAGLLAPAVTVWFATTDGSATAPGDYAAASGTLSFEAALLGATQTRTVTVTVAGDAIDELTETFGVVLSGSAEVPAGTVGVATIADDDPSPAIGVGNAPPAAEGASATFPVALSAPSGRSVVVAFTTVNASAVAGQDYTARSGTLTIPAGATSAGVTVALLDDGGDEPDETFELRLSAPTAATLANARGVGTIVDDDGLPASAQPPPPPPPPPLAPRGPSPPAGGSGTDPALPRLGLSSPRLQRPSTILVTVSCPREAGTCTGRVTIFSRANRRSKIRALRAERRLGRRSYKLTGGHSHTLRVALSTADRRLLRRVGRMNVRAYAVTVDGAGRTGVRRVHGTLISRTTHSA